MKRIAFVGHDLKFIRDIIDELENKNYEIKIDQWQGHNIHNEEYSREIVQWADIIFCEWGLGNVIWYQKNKKENQKLFVRVHRFEMNTNYPNEFDYKKIDKVIAISPYIFEEFNRVAKIPRDKMQVIFNGVKLEKFDKPKRKQSYFNLGIIGISPKLKRLDRAITILEELLKVDKRYKLYIKGKHPSEYKWIWNNQDERKFYDEIFDKIENNFKDNVIFEDWGDVGEWLKNIGYVLSVSDYESFHMAPVEGMASGAYPLVLNKREGTRCVFPNDFIFKDYDEIIKFILGKKRIFDLKDFVKRNYSTKKIVNEIENLF